MDNKESYKVGDIVVDINGKIFEINRYMPELPRSNIARMATIEERNAFHDEALKAIPKFDIYRYENDFDIDELIKWLTYQKEAGKKSVRIDIRRYYSDIDGLDLIAK